MQYKTLELGPGKDSVKKSSLDAELGNNEYNIDSIDYFTENKTTYRHNLDNIPWPIKNKTYDIVYSSHVLEHVNNLAESIDEIYRILKKDGITIIKMPHGSCGYAWGHPTHKRVAATNTFNYFGSYEEKYNKTKGFDVIKKELCYHRLWILGKIITKLANLNPRTQFIFE